MDHERIDLLLAGPQKERLRRNAKAAHKSLSQYVRDAVVQAMNEDEEKIRERRRDREGERRSALETPRAQGLFREPPAPRLRERQDVEPAPSQGLTVNVGAQAEGVGIAELAAWILKDPAERRRRLGMAADVIRETAPSAAAAERRAALLDDELAKIERKERTPLSRTLTEILESY